MSPDLQQMTVEVANRVLCDAGASPDRVLWAQDAIAAIVNGDEAAAERIGMTPGQFMQIHGEGRKAA